MLSSEVFRQAAGLDASEYAQFLRFYTVKPAYNGLVSALTRSSGANPYLALRWISTGSFLLIGLVCVLWLQTLAPPWLAATGALCLVSLPGTIGLARGLLPDGLLTALLLLGCFLSLGRRFRWAGFAVLVVATLVRPDALLFLAAYGVLTVWRNGTPGRRWLELAAVAAGVLGWANLLKLFTGALPWRVLFIHSFLVWTAPAGYMGLHVSFHQYLQVMSSNGVRTALFCLPLPALLCLIGLCGSRSRALRDVVLAGIAAVILRVLLFPGVEDRYYVWLVLLAGFGAVSAVTRDPLSVWKP